MHADDHHPGIRQGFADAPGQLHAAFIGQRNVHQGHIRLEFTGNGEPVAGVACLAFDHEMPISGNDGFEPLPEKRVVVDDHNPFFRGHWISPLGGFR